MNPALSYRLFDVTLLRKAPLSPSLCRFTFGGPAVAGMRSCAADQRIKVFFPDAQGRTPALPGDANWLAAYQALPPEARPPRRTYTIRALRAEAGEVDIDFVLHGATGPASRWATDAAIGDRLQIVAPDRAYGADPGGYEWRPPAELEDLLLIGDETALPAIAGILEGLARQPRPPRGLVFVEVPQPDDRLALPRWPGLRLEWGVRNGSAVQSGDTQPGAVQPGAAQPGAAQPGAAMIETARRAALPQYREPIPGQHALADIDVDRTILWEVAAAPVGARFYAWVAGEAAAVKTIRHILLKERGLPRAAVNLMGYWRQGQVLD